MRLLQHAGTLLGALGPHVVQLGVNALGEVGGGGAVDKVCVGDGGERLGHAVEDAAAEEAEDGQSERDSRQDAQRGLATGLPGTASR